VSAPVAQAEAAPVIEDCPLCGAPLAADQEWCLRCGAAARTRLAATPNWKAPVATIAVVAALALGVIAAALVKLAGDSGPAPAPTTTTVTTPAATGGGVTTATIPGASTATQPTIQTPGAGSNPTTPATIPTTPTVTSPGVVGGTPAR
jgi:hypothetical protein